MSNVKERILGAVTIMNENDALSLWNIIISNFSGWNGIETIAPDEIDKKMLDEIETDKDGNVFVSEADTMRELGLAE